MSAAAQASREPEPLWERRSAAYREALLALATPATPEQADTAATNRWPVPLRRHCQACSDGEHGRCERAVYCSPWWPCVPCECECRERERATVTPMTLTSREVRRQIGQAFADGRGPDYYRRIRLGGRTGGATATAAEERA